MWISMWILIRHLISISMWVLMVHSLRDHMKKAIDGTCYCIFNLFSFSILMQPTTHGELHIWNWNLWFSLNSRSILSDVKAAWSNCTSTNSYYSINSFDVVVIKLFDEKHNVKSTCPLNLYFSRWGHSASKDTQDVGVFNPGAWKCWKHPHI